jgi:hypothetical protein
MKVGPKVPGPGGPIGVGGTSPGEAVDGAKKPGAARPFAEALETSRASAAGQTPAAPAAGTVADVVARYGAGELTRDEAVRQVAESAVRAWPAELADEAARTRAVEEMAEVLAADPSFSALLDAAAGGPQ